MRRPTNGSAMCPHCGDVFDQAPSLLIPVHGEPRCAGSEQIARCPESDCRPLWNGEPNRRSFRYAAAPISEGDKP